MTVIAVVNKSTLVSDADVQTMTRACAAQIRYHAAPAFGYHAIPIYWLSDEKYAAPGSWVIAVLDNGDTADALGWHTEDQGDLIYGRVFAKPVLDNGGDALSRPLSVASVLSHECLETFADSRCNLWADTGQGYAVAYEIGDPVENDSYAISVNGVGVTVSNFVTPHWFDPMASQGDRFDWLGYVKAPFEMTQGGYVVRLKEGKVDQIFGEKYPEWRKESKQIDVARTARRVGLDQSD